MFRRAKAEPAPAPVAAVPPTAVADDDALEEGSSVEENDPALLAELAAVVAEPGDGSPEAQLRDLRQELASEEAGYKLFQAEGEGELAEEMLPRIKELRAQVAVLEKQLCKVDPAVLRAAVARREDYRRAASAWLRVGDKEAAKQWLSAAKSLEAPIAAMERGEMPDGFTVPPPPPEPTAAPTKAAATQPAVPARPAPSARGSSAPGAAAATASAAAAPKSAPPTAASLDDDDDWTLVGGPTVPPSPAKLALDALHAQSEARRTAEAKLWSVLIDTLKEEARRCNSMAKELKETDKKIAVEYLRRQKETMTMLETATALEASGAPAPRQWDTGTRLEFRRVRVNQALSEGQMAIEIVRGFDMVNEGGELLNAFCKVLLPYNVSGKREEDDQVFTTPSQVGSRNLVWNWSQVVPIARKKSFQQFLERKKIKIELWEIHGLFRSQRLLGRADVPLDVLLKEVTMTGVFGFMNGRKKLGPSVEVAVKLRVPLLAADEASLVEQFVRVPQWPAAGPGDEERRVALEEKRLQDAVNGVVPSEGRTNPFASWKGDAKQTPNDPDRFVSLAVLEALAQHWTAVGVRVQNDPAALADANEHLRRAHMRTFALTVWVQEGHCSKADYEAALQRAVAEEKALAMHFKNADNKTEALECLRRVKLMQGELESGAALDKEEADEAKKPVEAPTPSKAPAVVKAPAAAPPPPRPAAKPAAAAVAAAAAPATAEDNRAALRSSGQARPLDHHSVNLICSVAVLDWELGLCAADTEHSPEEVSLRRVELETKKTLMLMAIERGQVQVEDYANALKTCVTNDRALAKTFLNAGNRAEAKYCLARAKVMEDELQG